MVKPSLNKKVLIVEDDKDFLWIVEKSFVDEGFFVTAVQSGEEGLDAAKKEKPDLIILDIILPKMDGIDMAKKLREAGDNVRIIFLTNMEDTEHIKKAVEIKDSDYIVKSDMRVDEIVARAKSRLGL